MDMDSAGTSGKSGMIIKCSLCGKIYKVHHDRLPQGVSSFPCRKCGSLLPIHDASAPDHENNELPEDAPTILVAVNEDELATLVRRILRKHSYRALIAFNGQETLDAVRENPVDLLLINVFLPDMMVFEVLDRIREERDEGMIPTILLSSVHHAARYKRAPTSLYGADEYLERHHLPDLLIPKIKRLLDGGEEDKSPVLPDRMPPLSDEQVLQRRELEEIESAPRQPEDTRDSEIRRMCRVIAGDIALYNEDVIRSTEPDKLLDTIADDLKEGEALLGRKYPEAGEDMSHLLREEIVLLLQTRGIRIP